MNFNFDVANATEFWQPCFQNLLFSYKNGFIYSFTYSITALHLIYKYFIKLNYNCYGSLIGRLLLTDLREKKHELICQTADAGFNF